MNDSPHFSRSTLTDAELANIPPEMKAVNRWVNWRPEKRDGTWTKVPIIAGTPGTRASSTDPATWRSFQQALAGFRRHASLYGIGFVLGDGWVGVDFDHALRDGQLHPWCARLVADLGTYAEVSPSGDGVKAICRSSRPLVRADGKTDKNGNPLQGGNRKNYPEPGMAVESYAAGRYFTVTGRVYGR